MALLTITLLILAWLVVGAVVAGLCWAAHRGDANLDAAEARAQQHHLLALR